MIAFSSDDETLISEWRRELTGERPLGLVVTDDARSGELEAFCDALAQRVPEILVQKEREGGDQAPGIRIGPRIRYEAAPLGMELWPFLNALNRIQASEKDTPQVVREKLARLTLPATLKVYVTPQCPYCPQTVSRLIPLTLTSDLLHLIIIDAGLFPEKAESDQVRSVPTTLLDDRFRWTGVIDPEEVVGMMLDRDPSQLGAETLRRMLHEGDAEALSRMMVESGKVYPAYLDLLTDEKWTVRLGAMVALEFLVELRRTLASEVIEPLWERFPEVEDRIKGDILHVFGETGAPDAIPKLESVLNGPYADEVMEAAAEALEKVRGQGSGTGD